MYDSVEANLFAPTDGSAVVHSPKFFWTRTQGLDGKV